jgi:hypothetical protein
MKSRVPAFGRYCAIAAVIAAVAGCSASDRQTSDDGGEPAIGALVNVSDLKTFSLPLDPYRIRPENLPATVEAEKVLLARCLRRFGTELPPGSVVSSSTPAGKERLYGITDEQQARQRGYHLPTQATPSDTQENPLPPRVQAIAFGDGQRSYAGQQVPEGGCVGESRRNLTAGRAMPRDQWMGDRLSLESTDRTRRDSRVREVFAEWSSCMKRSGYDYADPMKSNDDPEFATEQPSPREIAVAIADVRCKEETNLVNVQATVHIAYQKRMLAHNAEPLAEVKQYLANSERNAAAVLADR